MRITSDKFGVFDFLIDNDEVEKIKQYHWSLMHVKQKELIVIYAPTNNKKLPSHLRLLHRLIMNANKGYVIDHIDGNTLDMRRQNMRQCTNGENLKNRQKPITNKSGVKGVYWDWHIPTPKWRANIKVNDKSYHLGYYDDFEDAVEARKQAEIKYQGEFSRDYGDLVN